MKVTIDQKDLAEAVAQASRAVSNRATLPVLSGLRISANGKVEVAATDLELTSTVAVDVESDEEGTVIVPGKMFAAMVKNLKGQTIRLYSGDGEVELQGDRATYRVKALATDDYPSLPIDSITDAVALFTLDAATFASAIAQTVRAASGDESRQVLTGVSLEVEGDRVTMVATDSYRLAVREMPCQHRTPLERPAERVTKILPARALAEVGRLLKKADSVQVQVGSNLATFRVGGVTIGARYIEGEFPNWRQLIPASYPNLLTVDRIEAIEVAKRVSLMAQNNLPVKLRMGRELEISAHTPDIGEASETFPAEYSGEEMVIAFNPQFLVDALTICEGDRVTIETSDGLKPAVISGASADFRYLLMPVRLS